MEKRKKARVEAYRWGICWKTGSGDGRFGSGRSGWSRGRGCP